MSRLIECEYCGTKVNGQDRLEMHRETVCFQKVRKAVKCFKCKNLKVRKLYCNAHEDGILCAPYFASECREFEAKK